MLGVGSQDPSGEWVKDNIAVLMIRVEICPDITFSSKNTLTFPLIMYSKCVRSNLF